MPDGRFLVARAPEGFPTWAQDEQVVAFMFKPAARTGLRTTVGWGKASSLPPAAGWRTRN